MAVEIALLKAARPDLDPLDRGTAAPDRAAREAARGGERPAGPVAGRGAAPAASSASPAPARPAAGPPPADASQPAGRPRRRRPSSPKPASAAEPRLEESEHASRDAGGAEPRTPQSDAAASSPPVRRPRPREAACGSGRRSSTSCGRRAPALAATLRGGPAGRPSTRGVGLRVGFPAERDLQQAQGRGAGAARARSPRRCETVTGERAAAGLRPARRREAARRDGRGAAAATSRRGAAGEAEERVRRGGGRARWHEEAVPGAST